MVRFLARESMIRSLFKSLCLFTMTSPLAENSCGKYCAKNITACLKQALVLWRKLYFCL